MTRADATFAEHQARIGPRTLDAILDVARKIRNRRRAARQALERSLGLELTGFVSAAAVDRERDASLDHVLRMDSLRRARIALNREAEATDLEAKPREVRSDTRAHFTAIAFHPNGRFLLAASNDQTVKLYDTTTWEPARAFTWSVGRMRSVCFSPDGTLAAAGSERGKIVVWDVDL